MEEKTGPEAVIQQYITEFKLKLVTRNIKIKRKFELKDSNTMKIRANCTLQLANIMLKNLMTYHWGIVKNFADDNVILKTCQEN